MKSMTGFGRATSALGRLSLEAQVSSVNRKSLDLTQKLPDEWQELEAEITERVRKVALRGKVHFVLSVSAGESSGAAWDEDAVRQSLQRLRSLAEQEGITWQATPELLWQLASAQRGASALPALESCRKQILDTSEAALSAFAAMRAREGAHLQADFEARLALIRAAVQTITERAPSVVPAYREALLKRLREAGLELELSDERVLREIALFADRCDVAEELTRLASHLAQFAALLRSEGEVGRKAEFLLQEIGREVNTIGSKANDLTISRQVIELKNELERIREQMANVE